MRYIAFLRAINVGGHVVKMERLRQIFEELGLTQVESFINSGNVLFDSPRSARQLENSLEPHLLRQLGFPSVPFLRTPAELDALTKRLEPIESPVHVAFLREAPDAEAQERILALRSELDDFQFSGREMFWLIKNGRFSDSKLSGARLEKLLGQPATLRNATTVRKLAAKVAG